MTTKLWEPSAQRIADSNFARFLNAVNAHISTTSYMPIRDFDNLHNWSLDNLATFWDLIWDFGSVRGEKGNRLLIREDDMLAARFFPDARLNFAENLLKKTGDDDALVFWGEDKVRDRWRYDDLNAMVSQLQQAMVAQGVVAGDRVAAMIPNIPEAVATMLAATSLGAVWSSCSPDFGVRGVLDRFHQIEPKLFITCDGYYYNGKEHQIADKLEPIIEGLPSVEKVIVVDYAGAADNVAASSSKAVTLNGFVDGIGPRDVEFTHLPFDHPLYILFSSGTTGIPKCIVHGAGGTLLQHIKEHQIMADMRAGDRVFYFTTCGWAMWNWIVGALATDATVMLYDGSPFAPDPNVLFDFAEQERWTFFGTSAKFIDALKKNDISPHNTHDLSSVRVVTSTGGPLSPESFDYIYAHAFPNAHLISMSGGTDILGCFVSGVPDKPVYRGEIQGPGLAMAVDVWDDNGRSITQEKGELVCTKPFPSQPIMFWNDPDGRKYRAAYYDRFDNCWCHGDFAEWTETGGMIIHGRSDATLNPGGVRIGTAEIYNQVEQMDAVVEALCIGQVWDDDVRIVLFVRVADGHILDDELIQAIKTKIRTGASPRHVPAVVIAVDDIPRTKSGKIVELAVREVVHGRAVKNVEALANAEALELFRDLPELRVP